MMENNNKDNNKNLGLNNKVQFKGEKKEEKISSKKVKKVSSLSVFIFKHFKIIILLEILFILILGYFFIIRAEVSEVGNYDELVSQREAELLQIKKYKKNFSKFEEEYSIIEKQVEEDIDKLYDILPPEEDLPNIMAQIEALVKDHGFGLGSISMSSEKKNVLGKKDMPLIASQASVEKALIKEVDIDIFVFSEDGGYDRVKELLDALENHIRFLDITSFGFEKDMESYSIILKTYYLNYEE